MSLCPRSNRGHHHVSRAKIKRKKQNILRITAVVSISMTQANVAAAAIKVTTCTSATEKCLLNHLAVHRVRGFAVRAGCSENEKISALKSGKGKRG